MVELLFTIITYVPQTLQKCCHSFKNALLLEDKTHTSWQFLKSSTNIAYKETTTHYLNERSRLNNSEAKIANIYKKLSWKIILFHLRSWNLYVFLVCEIQELIFSPWASRFSVSPFAILQIFQQYWHSELSLLSFLAQQCNMQQKHSPCYFSTFLFVIFHHKYLLWVYTALSWLLCMFTSLYSER